MTKDYLEIAKKILKISCTPTFYEYTKEDFDANLFAAQALAAAAIQQAQAQGDQVVLLGLIEKRLRFIGACLADIAKEAER